VTPLAYNPPLEYDVERLFTWSDTPSNYEQSAANNVTWYLAFAFCAWDRGRLPTEAEWSYALVGGDEQRPHPWGDEPPDATRAVLLDKDDTYESWLLRVFMSVGSRPAGRGRFGQLDLGGSRSGWALDAVDPVDSPNRGYIMPCVDCIQVETDVATYRVYADPPFSPDDDRSNQYSWVARPDHHDVGTGIRCARDLP
jgi:formylglycine-generating enzyme required for sulfatase activity